MRSHGAHGEDFESVGFHLQQAVEKRLKALILLKGVRPDRTHNISLLLDHLQALGVDVEPLRTAALLSDFAVRLRYEVGDESDERALEVGRLASTVVAARLRAAYVEEGFEPPGTREFPEDVDPKRVGRNEPCPCGSALKFKSCHYGPLRGEGRI